MYEHHSAPLLSRRLFWRRMLRHGGAAFSAVILSLAGGTIGYHAIAGLPWIDAFENASMILGGMGPVAPMTTSGGKLFAACFALYAGVVFLLVAGLLFTPLAHRLLHHFHLERGERHR